MVNGQDVVGDAGQVVTVLGSVKRDLNRFDLEQAVLWGRQVAQLMVDCVKDLIRRELRVARYKVTD